MPNLTVRDVPEPVLARLKEIAKGEGRSVQQQVLRWLEELTADRLAVLGQIESTWEAHRYELRRKDPEMLRFLDRLIGH